MGKSLETGPLPVTRSALRVFATDPYEATACVSVAPVSLDDEPVPKKTDYLVIGSGFGGSVMAAKLAEDARAKGLCRPVTLFERGKSYPPGAFPRTPDGFATNFWDPSAGLHGLFNVWSFTNIDAIVSSGLGGSLIYANVMLEKPEDWFTQPIPDGTGEETWSFSSADLAPHYEAVKTFLQVQTLPDELVPESPKTTRFLNASGGVSAPLAVRFHDADGVAAVGAPLVKEPYGSIFGSSRRTTCRMIGECDIGCNEGAKSSMDHTYLSKAHDDGASIHTRTEVRGIHRISTSGPYRFTVSYVRHPTWAEGTPTDTRNLELHSIEAKRVILAAGALGSTYLMLKNRECLSMPLDAQTRVGQRFSGNGDLLGLAIPAHRGTDFAATRGPVITAYRRYESDVDSSRAGRPAHIRMYLQDGGVPAIVLWVLKAVDAPGVFGRLVKGGATYLWQRKRGTNDNDVSNELSQIFGRSSALARSLPILGMGADVPDGVLSINGRGILENSWSSESSQPHLIEVRRQMNALMQALGAKFKIRSSRPANRVVTVHPLGGCPADTTACEGVVDPYGRVRGVPGLWITDGSVMPGPVGANPSLTIAAFAHRAGTELLLEDPDGDPSAAIPFERS